MLGIFYLSDLSLIQIPGMFSGRFCHDFGAVLPDKQYGMQGVTWQHLLCVSRSGGPRPSGHAGTLHPSSSHDTL